MTEPPKRRVLDPSKVRPLSWAELEEIYGTQGLSFYSPVRPRRSVKDEVEAPEQSPRREATTEGTDE